MDKFLDATFGLAFRDSSTVRNRRISSDGDLKPASLAFKHRNASSIDTVVLKGKNKLKKT